MVCVSGRVIRSGHNAGFSQPRFKFRSGQALYVMLGKVGVTQNFLFFVSVTQPAQLLLEVGVVVARLFLEKHHLQTQPASPKKKKNIANKRKRADK